MKYLLSLLMFIAVTTYSQDTVTITHKAYKTTYSKSKQYPIKVEWWLTRNMFKAGVASSEAAVRRLREEYYEAISKAVDSEQ